MLDLRYNEMFHEWDGIADELQEHCTPDANGRMVLSWKRLNVSVKQIDQRFFKRSKITHKQILHNGNYYKLLILHEMRFEIFPSITMLRWFYRVIK